MSLVKGRRFIDRFESFAPPALASEGDPIGLHFGRLDQVIHRILVTLDLRPETVAEAIEKNCDFIFAHHPPIFRPIKTFRTDRAQEAMYAQIIKYDLTVYAAHTNLDLAEGGMNDWLAEALGLKETEIMDTQVTYEGKAYGFGRIGILEEVMTFSELIQHMKEVFSLPGLRYIGDDLGRPVKQVAIMGGSGSSFYQAAADKGADVYITGDLSYHYGHDIQDAELYAIDPGHHIEAICIPQLSQLFTTWTEQENWELEIVPSQVRTEPFRFA